MTSLIRFVEQLLGIVVDHGDILLPPLFAFAVLGLVLILRWRAEGARRASKWAVAALCTGLAIVSGLAFAFERGVHRAVEHRAARLRLEMLADGSTRRVADYAGQVVVLNFWATWCPPCRAEMPDLNRLADDYRRRGLVVLSASDEARERIRTFAAQHPMSTESAIFTDAVAPTGGLERTALSGRPTTLILDRKGRVKRLLIGRRSFGEFAKAVEPYL